MFKLKQATPENLVDLLQRCGRKRDDLEAPAWKEYINDEVESGVFGLDGLAAAGMVAENNHWK